MDSSASDSEDEVYFGPITSRERVRLNKTKGRRTELFSINFRQSLLDYRQGNNADSSDVSDNEPMDENISCVYDKQESHKMDGKQESPEEMDHKHESPDEMDHKQESPNEMNNKQESPDDFDKVSCAETTYYTCLQNSQDNSFCDTTGDEFEMMGEETNEQLTISKVSKSVSRALFVEETENEDGSIRSDVEFIDLGVSDSVSDTDVEEDNFTVEIKTETVSQSCQTSFLEVGSDLNSKNAFLHPCSVEERKEPSPSLFKMPLGVKKPTNTNSASKIPQSATKAPFNRFGFASPNTKIPKFSPQTGKRFDHIVSPISQYINEAPAPPLVINIRSRDTKSRNLSPVKSSRVLRSMSAKICPEVGEAKRKQISKENSHIEVSDEVILKRFGLSMEDFNKLEDKTLKKTIQSYIRKERLSQASNTESNSQENTASLFTPVVNYQGPAALAVVPERKHIDLLTKIHTFKNSKLPMPTPRPIVMKHVGERKKIRWGDTGIVKLEGATSPIHLKFPQRLDDSCMHNEKSMVDVSMVEVSSPACTRTLFRK